MKPWRSVACSTSSVSASVEAGVPHWLRNSGRGWVTAEYGMLPRATHTRGDRLFT